MFPQIVRWISLLIARLFACLPNRPSITVCIRDLYKPERLPWATTTFDIDMKLGVVNHSIVLMRTIPLGVSESHTLELATAMAIIDIQNLLREKGWTKTAAFIKLPNGKVRGQIMRQVPIETL